MGLQRRAPGSCSSLKDVEVNPTWHQNTIVPVLDGARHFRQCPIVFIDVPTVSVEVPTVSVVNLWVKVDLHQD